MKMDTNMTKVKKRVCPYKECVLESGWANSMTQSAFLFIAYAVLATSASSFTPLAVILYIIPPVIDLCFKKMPVSFLFCIKCFLLFYAFVVVMACFLIIAGSLMDQGAYYVMSENTLIQSGLSLSKSGLAYSMVLIVPIPIILKASKPERIDKTVLNQYIKRR